jgi:hypothetical protein
MFERRGIMKLLVTGVLALAVALPVLAQDQLPAGFTGKPIGEDADGSVAVKGGVYTITGKGQNLWDVDNDHFFFVSKEVTGDGNVTARLLTSEGGDPTGWEKLGTMIRDSDAQGSVHATSYMNRPRGGGVYYLWRPVLDEGTQESSGFAPAKMPIWLRAQRVGNEITGFHSQDGVLWQSTRTETVNYADNTALFGVHVMPHGADTTMTTTWDNIAVTEGQTQVAGLAACPSDKGVLLTWKALKGAKSYVVMRGPAGAGLGAVKLDQLQMINTDAVAGTSFSDLADSLPAGGRHVYAVAAVMENGSQGPLTAVVSGKTGPPTPPAGFNFTVFGDHPSGECARGDIGVEQDANGVITMRSGGFDLWDATDHFTFLHQKAAGNVRVTATFLTRPTFITLATKAGVILRDGLTADARHVLACLTDGIRTQWRTEKGGDAEEYDVVIDPVGLGTAITKAPVHLRLERRGDVISTFYSFDGATFEPMGDPVSLAGLPNEVEVGVALTARDRDDNARPRISEVQFRDIKIEKL